ncbi:MAG: GIY-YIG nuclease family protein [Planctomycetota bacterium]
MEITADISARILWTLLPPLNTWEDVSGRGRQYPGVREVAGFYVITCANTLVYIGESGRLSKRLWEHFRETAICVTDQVLSDIRCQVGTIDPESSPGLSTPAEDQMATPMRKALEAIFIQWALQLRRGVELHNTQRSGLTMNNAQTVIRIESRGNANAIPTFIRNSTQQTRGLRGLDVTEMQAAPQYSHRYEIRRAQRKRARVSDSDSDEGGSSARKKTRTRRGAAV